MSETVEDIEKIRVSLATVAKWVTSAISVAITVFFAWRQIDQRLSEMEKNLSNMQMEIRGDVDRTLDRVHNLEDHVQWRHE
jgi:HAMP domain-containing protein